MTHCFMTGRPPTCSDSTDVPVVPSVGKLQTTLHTLGGKAIIWSCRQRSTRVSPYNGNDAAAAASRLLKHSLPQAT